MNAITVANVWKPVFVAAAVRNVRQFVRIVMKNAPIVRMQKSVADVMFVRIALAEKETSAITVKPV